MAGRDITEGDDGVYALAGDGLPIARGVAELGIVSTTSLWQNTSEAYDVALGGLPFFYAISDSRPYVRQTAPFKKDQFDNGAEPGEQSLTGWWIRSQSSFHGGTGIKFYDPSAGETVAHRFADSRGVNVWTKGQVTLLNSCIENHEITGAIDLNTRPNQHMQSIHWDGIDGVLLQDEYDIDKLFSNITVSISNKALTTNVATLTTTAAHGLKTGMEIVITGVDATFNGEYRITSTPTTTTFTYAKTNADVPSAVVSPVGTGNAGLIHFVDYNSGTDTRVFAIANDGTNAYWITNEVNGGANKLAMYKKALTADSTTAGTLMFRETGLVVTNAAMAYIKERLVLCINNKVYEVSTSATSLSTAIYTHPTSTYTYTSVSESGPAIYCSGFNGSNSSILKFTLNTSGVMPTLTSAITSAEMPSGEVIYKIYQYLGYIIIGTSKGVRVGVISETDGGINYGPLVIHTTQPVYDFAARDRFVWCASSVNGLPGLTRIDLGNEIEQLRFAYANDVYYDTGSTAHKTTACAFMNGSDIIAFSTAYANSAIGHVYKEDTANKITSGYITTGNIRYGTLEPKNFKRLLGRGDFTKGSLTLETVDRNGVEYDHITYSSTVPTIEVTTSVPEVAQEYVAYKFVLNRDATTTSAGPIFMGYQAKATIATPRQRVLQFPVYCFDIETDRYNVITGYEGKAQERLLALENVEENGDVLTWQDLTTGESRQVVIEQISFTRMTPPDRRFDGFGGVIQITIRTV